MRALRLAAGLAAVMLMSGCGAEITTELAAPTPTAPLSSETAPSSSEPTPKPTVDLVVTTAVIFGTRIEWRNEAGDVIDSVGFTDSTALVSKVTEHFGAAKEEQDDDRGCSRFIFYGAGHLVVLLQPGGPVELQLFVAASEVNGIRIETPSGHSAGEEAWDLIDSTDPELKQDVGAWHPHEDYTYWSVIYDPVGTWGEGTAEPRRFGARAMVELGALTTIMVPGTLGIHHTEC